MSDIPTAILPCPFCGEPARVRGAGYRGSADCYGVQVQCDDCDAQGPSWLVDASEGGDEAEAVASAIAAWNRRVKH